MKKPINTEVKQGLFLLLSFGFFAGCTTWPTNYVKTVNSDLYPTEMSRDQYYEELGMAYAKDHQTEKAIEEFRLALLHNPRRTSARVALADQYRKMEMNQLAANELTEVLQVEPDNTDALLKLGDLYLSAQIYAKSKQLFAQILENNPKNDKARWLLFYMARLEKDDVAVEKYLNEIAPTENNKVKLLFEKALLAKRQGREAERAEWIRSAYALDPHDRKVCLEMAQQLVDQSDFDSARIVLSHYSQAHDFDLEVSQHLVYAAVRTEQYEMAFDQLEQQKQIYAGKTDIELKQAHVYFLSGDLKSAEDVYQQILEKDPEQDQARFYLGQIHIRQNLKDSARDTFDQLTAASSYYADAQIWLAADEAKQGKSQLALQRLEEANEKRPDQLSLYQAYAYLLIREKQFEKAVGVLRSGSDFFPQNEDFHIQAAVAYFRMGDHVQFKKSIDRAMQINPENAEIYASLAEIWYLEKANPKDIESFAKKALDFKTKNKNMKPLLAWALMAQDRSIGAVALFEKFYEENPRQPFYAEALSKVYQAADILGKADRLSQQSQQLENRNRLQSDLIFGSQRSPASLQSP